MWTDLIMLIQIMTTAAAAFQLSTLNYLNLFFFGSKQHQISQVFHVTHLLNLLQACRLDNVFALHLMR